MKLTIILLTACCLNVCASSLAQNVSFSGKNVSLESVFSSVKKQTGFLFLYSEPVLKSSKPVSITANNLPLDQFLAEVFKSQPHLRFDIKGKSVLVFSKTTNESSDRQRNSPGIGELIPFAPLRAKILDQDGQPLVGASVTIKKSSTSAITDAEGYFSLNVNEGDILVVTYVGYQSKEIKVTAGMLSPDNTFIITLSKSNTQLDTAEVVVNTGYEQVAPERFIGSATVVDSAILERQEGRDLLTRLDGTTNGILFNKLNGAANIQIQLRGVATLNTRDDLNGLSSQNPLIILDDFPFSGNINSLNPNDVFSISILKDAVATSIWGARAGNGVIVIKSKSGRLNKPFSLRITSNISIAEKPDPYYFPQMSSSDFIDAELNLFEKGFYNQHIQFPQVFTISPVVEILAKQENGDITEAEAKAEIDALRSLDVRREVEKYIYRWAVNKQHYLNMSGGTSTVGYNLSFGADNNLTNVQGPGQVDRYTLKSEIRFKPIKQADFQVGVDYNQEKNRYDGIGYPIALGSKIAYPYAKLIDEGGKHAALPHTYGFSYLEGLPSGKLLDWYYRPLDERDNTNYLSTSKLLRLNLGANVRITPWLSGSLKYQYNMQTVRDWDLKGINSFFTRNMINRYTNRTSFNRSIPYGGILDLLENELSTYYLRGQLNVSKRWNVHDFSAMIAGEMSESQLNRTANRFYGYNDDVMSYATNIDYLTRIPLYPGGTSTIPPGDGISERNSNLLSFIVNASYTYDSRYGLYLSGRRDGSNLFGVSTNNKYKPLWSLGGRWNITNEPFFTTNTFNNLSIRISYGYAGNINNTISAISTIQHSSSPNIFGQPYVRPTGATNPDLRWEEVRTINAGVDFGLFNDRISGSVDIYRKRSTDIIASFPLDPTLGIVASTMNKNAAHLIAKGFDLAIQSQNLQGKIKWVTNLNVNYAKTVVSKYFVEAKSVPDAPIIREGDIYMGIYAYRWAGLDPETGDPRGYIGKEISKDYRGIFFDSLANQQYIGSTFPLAYGNMLNTVSYLGFSLSANISFRANYYFRKPSIDYNQLFNSWAGHSDYSKRWQQPGDEITTNVPSMPYPANADRDKFYALSAVNFEKGDHVRLQDIRLSYTWHNHNKARLPLKSIEVYGYIGNMNFMIWKATKAQYDPDFPTSTIPPVKTYSFGANVNF